MVGKVLVNGVKRMGISRFPALGTLFKIGLSVALFYWLIQGGVLDLSELAVFLHYPWLIVAAIAFWLLGPVMMASLRWKILLDVAGFQLSWLRAIRLQLVGVFFTTAMPGSLGGDVVKAVYLISDNPDKSKTLAMWSIVFDRIVGMCGLFLIGVIFILINSETIWQIKALRAFVPIVLGYVVAFGVLMLFIKASFRWKVSERSESTGLMRLVKALFRFVLAIRVFGSNFRVVCQALLLSVFAHGLSFMFFVGLCLGISQSINLSNLPELGAIFPVGMLITTLPISPGGLGVGHLAFSELFELVSLQSGANIFNAYFVSQLLLNLTGVLSYFTMSVRRKPNPSDQVSIELPYPTTK
ncbi:MAG: flippase-like domain-containing protein [Pseudomonadales bacterium]|nr:flippase-like domain-containing protein [Pseudomonadales bacterium]